MSKNKSDILSDLQVLAFLTTPQQNYEAGKQLKLTRRITLQYIEGKGKNKQLAEKLYKALSDLWLKDELLRIESDLKGLAKMKIEIHGLEKDLQLRGDMARVIKRNFDLVLTEIPDGVDRIEFKSNYFLQSAKLLTDTEAYNEMVAYIENITSDARLEIVQKNSKGGKGTKSK